MTKIKKQTKKITEVKKVTKSNYTAKDIDLLEGLSGVRKRPAMYIGSTNLYGLHHLVWEVVDNGIDEALSGYGSRITIIIHKDGSLSVQDEGRGIPVDLHAKAKVPAVQLIFSTLHSGGKFSSAVYKTSAGLHGVGAAVTNALSEYLDVTVYRDQTIYHLRFEDGGKLVTPLEELGKTTKHGTLVRFKPDSKIFPSVEFKWETIYNRLQENAFLMKRVRFILKDERSDLSHEFYYPNGIREYVATLTENKKAIGPILFFEDEVNEIKIECALQYCQDDYNESIYSYANNVRTIEGGTHETGFRLGLTRVINDFVSEHNLLKGKAKLEGSDIREGLTAIISLRIAEELNQFEGQTKTKLGTPIATPAMNNFIYSKLAYYLNENKEYAVNLIKKISDARDARLAARKAKEEARKTKKVKNELIISDKLTPAQSKEYGLNELFIVEGESAGGTARKGRDRVHQAILPLRGKPLNTDNVTMERMLKNEEFATIISSIGAGVGSHFDLEDAKYGKIIIMTDADTDGAHIQTLLLTFFYHYMRPLIVKGKVFVAVPPLYRVYKEANKKLTYRYAWNDKDLEKAKKEIGAGYKISRYKGLGEMDAEQLWETTMNPKTRQLIRVKIIDPLIVENRVSVLMGKDASRRRKWVEENVDFSLEDTFLEEIK